MTPWLARCDQDLVFPNSRFFDSPAQQEAAIRAWVRQRSGHCPEFRIVFYAGAHACAPGLSPGRSPCGHVYSTAVSHTRGVSSSFATMSRQPTVPGHAL